MSSNDQPTDAGINWQDLYRRLEDARVQVERGMTPTGAEKQRILRARAQRLAQEPPKVLQTEMLEVATFRLAQEQYGVESVYVREVHPLKELTPLPCTPAFVLGIVNVRGRILAVLDLKKFFDLADQGLTDATKIIIVADEQMELGILADAILDVRSIPLTQLQPSLPTLTGIRAEYLRGVTHERLIVLEVGKLLSDPKIVVHEEVEA